MSKEELYRKWLEELRPHQPNYNRSYSIAQKEMDVVNFTKLWSRFILQRISLPLQSPVSPVTLGLYKGMYADYEIEVVNVTLAENGYELLVEKITGDRWQPAGMISLNIDLRQPLTLTREQQDLRTVAELKPETLPNPFRFPADASQPFALCRHVRATVKEEELPSTCKARYGGHARLGQFHFSSGHLVVFSDSYFGFYWIGGYTGIFSVYRLVEEDFS